MVNNIFRINKFQFLQWFATLKKGEISTRGHINTARMQITFRASTAARLTEWPKNSIKANSIPNTAPTPKITPVTSTAIPKRRRTEIQINQELEIRRFQTVLSLIPQFANHIHIKILNINHDICKKTLIKLSMITNGPPTNKIKKAYRNQLRRGKPTQWQLPRIMKSYKALRIFQIVSYEGRDFIQFQI